MRLLQSSVFRAVVAIIVGALLVKYREDTVTWLTIAIGVLFFLSGLTSVIIYYVNKRNIERTASEGAPEAARSLMTPAFPVGGLGSMVLGVILAFMPVTFIRGVVIILGAIVILATIGQFVSLAQARRYGSVPFFFWIFPSILFLIGVYCVVKPVDSASLPLFIIGWALMVYGVVECTNAFKIYRLKKAWQKMNEQAQKPQLDNIQDAEEVKESQDAETRKSSSDDAQA
jgi:EamA domain-containing membrane protein RarD